MLGAVYTGLSGLRAYSEGLQTISNNVANLNTAGFKSSNAKFGDTFYTDRPPMGGIGSGSQGQFGSGVTFAATQINFAQGEIRPSDGQLDLALQGNGFLVLSGDQGAFYARTGQFAYGDDGRILERTNGYQLNLLDGSGHTIPASVNGRRLSPPEATTHITFSENLSSTGDTHTISTVDVYDAAGTKTTLTLTFTNEGSDKPGAWKVAIADENGITLKESEIRFIGSIVDPSTERIDLGIGSGAQSLDVELDFSGVTSFSTGTTSSLKVQDKDGHGVGDLTQVSVDESGSLLLIYSNGQTQTLGSVAVATFNDPGQLKQVGGALFSAPAEMDRQLLHSGENGAAQVIGQATEASNVDISGEFGQLILVQRGFQASSQVMSMANEMIQQLFQLKDQR